MGYMSEASFWVMIIGTTEEFDVLDLGSTVCLIYPSAARNSLKRAGLYWLAGVSNGCSSEVTSQQKHQD